MDHPPPIADPILNRAELRLQRVSASYLSHVYPGSPGIRAELNRCDIAVVLRAYEWRGYRYANRSDAIAAAKRGLK